VVLVCDASLRDLEAYRRRSHFKAGRGGHGQGTQRHGADGQTLELTVPPGTEVLVETDGTRLDLVADGQRAMVGRGGSGGRGNKRFASATHQTPRFAERGLPGQETWLTLTLKLLADVGLIGLPNAGKSSLLSRLTRAHPKVADYPFTTLAPVLGTLITEDQQLVVADIPGLIEGASAGAGLGHEFLAHVERTRLLVHVLDLQPLDGSDPEQNHAVVERELAQHDLRLARLPRILALSKADLVEPSRAEEAQREWQARLGGEVPVLVTSSVSRLGLGELRASILRQIPPAPEPEVAHRGGDGAAPPAYAAPVGGSGILNDLEAPVEMAAHRTYRPRASRDFSVRRHGDGSFAVAGEGVERLVARYDLDNEEALAHLERRLRGLGVLRALEAEGFRAGDEVEIAGIAFDLDPDV
jgi:GTP-binding protein